MLTVSAILFVIVYVIEKELIHQAQSISDPTVLLTSVSMLAKKAMEAHDTLVRIGTFLIGVLWIAAPLDLLRKPLNKS